MWRFRFMIYLEHAPASPRPLITYLAKKGTLICQFRFFSFAKLLNSRPAAAARLKKRAVEFEGAQPAPQFAATMSLSKVLKGSICALFLLAGFHFEANLHGGLNKVCGGVTKQRKNTDRELVMCEGLSVVS